MFSHVGRDKKSIWFRINEHIKKPTNAQSTAPIIPNGIMNNNYIIYRIVIGSTGSVSKKCIRWILCVYWNVELEDQLFHFDFQLWLMFMAWAVPRWLSLHKSIKIKVLRSFCMLNFRVFSPNLSIWLNLSMLSSNWLWNTLQVHWLQSALDTFGISIRKMLIFFIKTPMPWRIHCNTVE